MLEGKTALVTGGGTGVGAAIAMALSNAGADVLICGRRAAPLEALAAQSARIRTATADVTDEDAVRELFSSHGPFDVVIANAGSAQSAPLAKTSMDQYHQMITSNLTGAFLVFQKSLNSLKDRKWGRLVAVASTAGLKGYNYVSAYCAAKHGVVGLVRSAALETATRGITVNAVCPGFTETPMLEDSVANIVEKTGSTEEAARAAMAKTNPMGRLIQPDEVAAAVLWLGPGIGCDHRPGDIHIRWRDLVTGAADSKARLRLWIRLLRSSRAVENEIRERLRVEFDMTLPRFDVLAALFRKPDGMLMSELSRYLMVSNGNVTGIVDRLVADGHVERAKRNGDRRTSVVRLTVKGQTDFERMARTHETWINDLFGDLSPDEVEVLSNMLPTFNDHREVHA